MSEIINELKEAIFAFNGKLSRQLAAEALEGGKQPEEILEGMTEAIRKIGDGFESGELFLPELVGAASAMSEAISVVEENLEKTGKKVEKTSTIVLGTVKGDIHDIGKTMVKAFLVAENFRVIDLGVDVAPEEFLEAIEKYDPEILALSALLTTTVAEQRKIIEILKEKGMRDRVKVIIGGAATNQEFADEIGADGYETTAPRAPRLCKSLLGKE
ncbi:MAG: cobalamin-dependent protein [Actinomycetia bacterium]|nr:cobalamin-dependent protein [Actinomycetes bacterium]